MINQTQLQRYANAFIMYEIADHGVDPRVQLDGTTMRRLKDEGYKYRDIENWKARLKMEGSYVDKVLAAMRETNLVDYHQIPIFADKAKNTDSILLESALTAVYEGSDDTAAFQSVVNILGRRFDILGFVFFLKDAEKFLPIRASIFDSLFARLGINSELEGKCSWDKYNEYNQWIAEIKDYLCANLNPNITLLDAHSFVWVLKGLDSYLDGGAQIVEHKKFGKGIVIDFDRDLIKVRFGKDVKSFKKDDAFNKSILRFVPCAVDVYGRKKDIYKPDEITEEANEEEDEKLVAELRKDGSTAEPVPPSYQAKPKEKPAAVIVKGHPVYARDRQTARNALALAGYRCEINQDDKTFIRKNTDKPYTEPHHLIPMAYQDQFEASLDCEGNIVSLCSSCHNEIHYGRDSEKLVEILYNERKDTLERCGIAVSLEQLLKMYQ